MFLTAAEALGTAAFLKLITMIQNLTRAEYDKLLECQVNDYGTWRNRKFVRRGKRWVVIAFLRHDGKPLMCSYSVYSVHFGGKQLAYGEVTNPKKPAPFI